MSPTEETTPATSSKRALDLPPLATVAGRADGGHRRTSCRPGGDAGRRGRGVDGSRQVTQGTTGTTRRPVTPCARPLPRSRCLPRPWIRSTGTWPNSLNQPGLPGVNAANEPATDFGLGTTGTLVQGDVYLVAGSGFTGWQNPIANGGQCRRVTSSASQPSRLRRQRQPAVLRQDRDRDQVVSYGRPGHHGELLRLFVMTAGTVLPSRAQHVDDTVPSPGIKLPDPFAVTGIAANSGLVSGGVQNVAIATNGAASTGAIVPQLHLRQPVVLWAPPRRPDNYLRSPVAAPLRLSPAALRACRQRGHRVVHASLVKPLFTATPTATSSRQCRHHGLWVLPAADGTLTIDGTSNTVTAGTAYKVAGDGTSPYTTAPVAGRRPMPRRRPISSGSPRTRAGNLVFRDGDSAARTFAGVYVVANASGTYYGATMTAGHLYVVAGVAHPPCCTRSQPRSWVGSTAEATSSDRQHSP